MIYRMSIAVVSRHISISTNSCRRGSKPRQSNLSSTLTMNMNKDSHPWNLLDDNCLRINGSEYAVILAAFIKELLEYISRREKID
jgi:hypothetical protein